MPMAIDLNRGVTKRPLPDGTYVCMYKDAPGSFHYTNGEEASPEAAERAGFPVKRILAEKHIRDEMARKEAELRDESQKRLRAEQDRLDREAGDLQRQIDESGRPAREKDPSPDRRGEPFSLVDMGHGWWSVNGAEGTPTSGKRLRHPDALAELERAMLEAELPADHRKERVRLFGGKG